MKRLALATLLAVCAPLAAAQVTVAPMDCGAAPEYPGRLGSDTQKRSFDKAYKAYDKCVRQYVEDRKAMIKANEVAAQNAIDEFNALVMKMRAESGADTSSSGSAPAKK